MPPKKKPFIPKLLTPVDSASHKDKHAYIPTEEEKCNLAGKCAKEYSL